MVVGLKVNAREPVDDCLFEFPSGEHSGIGMFELFELVGGGSSFAVVFCVPDEEGADCMPELSIYFLHVCFNYNRQL